MDALILSCGTGGGHNAAGRAIMEELQKRGHHAEMFNPYTLVSDRLAEEVDKLYIKMAQKTPKAFGFVYQLGNLYRKLPVKSPVYHVNKKMVPVMERYLEKHPADVIFMPHLYPAEVITQMKKQGVSLPLTVFVATDYVCIPFTEETNCDYYVIPGEELKADFIKRGIPEEKLLPYGIPTSAAFASNKSRQEAKKELHLQEEKQYLLISGGSIGAGQLCKAVRVLARHYAGTDKELLVICGNNTALYGKLSREYAGDKDRVHILMHTDRMADYMKACDVVLSKPGGLSSTEAAVSGTALLHITPIPGCETLNMEFFKEKGMSVPVETIDARLGKLCDKMLKEERRKRMVERQRQFISPCAAKDICDFAQKYVNYAKNVSK